MMVKRYSWSSRYSTTGLCTTLYNPCLLSVAFLCLQQTVSATLALCGTPLHCGYAKATPQHQEVSLLPPELYQEGTTLPWTERHAYVRCSLWWCQQWTMSTPNYLVYSGQLCTGLQALQNSAARVITRTGSLQHITPVLRDLHRPPVYQRFKYRAMCLVYKTLQIDMALQWLTDLLPRHRAGRYQRSASDWIHYIGLPRPWPTITTTTSALPTVQWSCGTGCSLTYTATPHSHLSSLPLNLKSSALLRTKIGRWTEKFNNWYSIGLYILYLYSPFHIYIFIRQSHNYAAWPCRLKGFHIHAWRHWCLLQLSRVLCRFQFHAGCYFVIPLSVSSQSAC